MRGGTEDSGRGRQKGDGCSFRNASAGFLLSRLLYLVDKINVSLGLIRLNDLSSYTGATLAMDEALCVRQEISEFLGLLCYMRYKHKELLGPHKEKIDNLKIKLGIYFI